MNAIKQNNLWTWTTTCVENTCATTHTNIINNANQFTTTPQRKQLKKPNVETVFLEKRQTHCAQIVASTYLEQYTMNAGCNNKVSYDATTIYNVERSTTWFWWELHNLHKQCQALYMYLCSTTKIIQLNLRNVTWQKAHANFKKQWSKCI